MGKMKQVFNIEDEISVKRFYFDGKVEIDCPHCGEKVSHDFGRNYLSYPTPGEELEFYFYCNSCEKESLMSGKLESVKIEVSYDLETLKKI